MSEKMKILYIAWSKQQPTEMYADPSVWYRCFQPAQALRDLGHTVNIVAFQNVTEEQIKAHDCVIFFRPLYSTLFVNLINNCEQYNKRYLASYDDLFFDIGYLRHSGFRKLGAPQEQILSDRPELYAKAFYFFDEFVSSTDGLKKAIKHHKPDAKVNLHYNGIPPEVHDWVSLLSKKNRINKRRLGYFAGGAIHTPDLLKIAPIIAQVLNEQNATFYCVETVKIPNLLLATGRIETTPRMNYSRMLHSYAQCSVTIAPLEVNDFTNSKSGIKFLESASLGNNVVATPIDDIVRVGNDLLFPALTDEDWYNQLTLSLNTNFEPGKIQRDAEQLIRDHSTKAEAESFLADLNSKVSEKQ